MLCCVVRPLGYVISAGAVQIRLLQRIQPRVATDLAASAPDGGGGGCEEARVDFLRLDPSGLRIFA